MATGGGLPLEEGRDRAADPACAEATRAGAGQGSASPWKDFNPGHQPSHQGLRLIISSRDCHRTVKGASSVKRHALQ